MRDFGRREFQLSLLRRMRDYQPSLVRDALQESGATNQDVLAAHQRWQQMTRSARVRTDFTTYRNIFGPPDQRGSHQTAFGIVEVWSWEVSLWPGLCWQIISESAGRVLQGELSRPAGAHTVPVTSEPQPWTLVASDVVTNSAVRLTSKVDRETPSRTTFTARRDGGRQREYVFVWGLLQRARVLAVLDGRR